METCYGYFHLFRDTKSVECSIKVSNHALPLSDVGIEISREHASIGSKRVQSVDNDVDKPTTTTTTTTTTVAPRSVRIFDLWRICLFVANNLRFLIFRDPPAWSQLEDRWSSQRPRLLRSAGERYVSITWTNYRSWCLLVAAKSQVVGYTKNNYKIIIILQFVPRFDREEQTIFESIVNDLVENNVAMTVS